MRGTRDVPIALCGSKCDLESERTVSTSEGEELAQRMGAVFYETSALADININVHQVFYAIICEKQRERKALHASLNAKLSVHLLDTVTAC